MRSAAVAAGGVALANAAGASSPVAPVPLNGRFLTHVSVVRVNQIEVTPTRNIGQDESADNTTENMRARRDAFARGYPGGRMTWAISWLALYDQRQQYKDVRRLLAEYHDKHNDEVTFIPGGYFAPMYASREDNRKTIHQALLDVSKMVGGGYRPESLVAGFLDAENQQHLASEEGIHVCQGQIWSQHGIDNGDGDGGICYPYYPSKEHYLKPAQGRADFIDCVCLDGWTCDFFNARREGFEGKFNSRQGVGPIETVQDLGEQVGRKEMLDTTAMHFDGGHALNGFGFVTGIWELSLGNHQHLEWWLQTVRGRWPDTHVMTEGEFGLEWRRHNPDNSRLNYRFDVQGTGAPGSEKDLEIQWYMNQQFRLELLGPAADKSKRMAIDFTRYDLPAHEPRGLQREWSLMNLLNQKGTRRQDKPMRLGQLPVEDQRLIFKRYPELKSLA
jgi:hypothetical protein